MLQFLLKLLRARTFFVKSRLDASLEPVAVSSPEEPFAAPSTEVLIDSCVVPPHDILCPKILLWLHVDVQQDWRYKFLINILEHEPEYALQTLNTFECGHAFEDRDISFLSKDYHSIIVHDSIFSCTQAQAIVDALQSFKKSAHQVVFILLRTQDFISLPLEIRYQIDHALCDAVIIDMPYGIVSLEEAPTISPVWRFDLPCYTPQTTPSMDAWEMYMQLAEEKIQAMGHFVFSHIKKQETKSVCAALSTQVPAKNVIMLAAHRPKLDPRLDWLARSVPEGIQVTQMGLDVSARTLYTVDVNGREYCDVVSFTSSDYAAFVHMHTAVLKRGIGKSVCDILTLFDDLVAGRSVEYDYIINTLRHTGRLVYLTALLEYIVHYSVLIYQHVVNMTGCHAIIATDFVTLPVALLLKSKYNIPVIYDAHEYWPEAFGHFSLPESQFWHTVEHKLVSMTDRCYTVSSHLARYMTRTYGKVFDVLPNAMIQHHNVSVRHPEARHCKFIFQGCFSPDRGTEELIALWDRVDPRASLYLRGPESEYRQTLMMLAENTGLLDQRIFFLPSLVDESALLDGLLDYQVGLISYIPKGANNTFCCPNKLSQYLSVGLPILANQLPYVASIVKAAAAGISLDFSEEQRLIDMINYLTQNPSVRQQMSQSARIYFQNSFHWQHVARDFNETLRSMLEPVSPGLLAFA